MSVFDRSIIAGPTEIAGVRLRLFSAYHALALLALESPYITREREPHRGDTTLALVVCTLKRSDGMAQVERAIGSLRWRWYWLWHNHEAIAGALLEHINNSLEFPAVWETEEKASGGCTGAPWPYYLVSTVAQHLNGVQYSELWDMPIAELICHKAIIGEEAGAYQLADNDLAKIKRRRAEKAA